MSHITVNDLINTDRLRGLRLIAGAGGLLNRVGKVGILDFEFTREGSAHCIDQHWIPNEFVLSTFLYAAGNDALLFEAVKKLNESRASGIAIKNVFSLEISSDVVDYANEHDFPLLMLTDNSLFFEDIIIRVSELIKSTAEDSIIEEKLEALLSEEADARDARRMALEVNYAFKNSLVAAYFSPRSINASGLQRTRRIGRRHKGTTSAAVAYRSGFFFIQSADASSALDADDATREACISVGVRAEDFFIGRSDTHSDLSNFARTLSQSIYASSYSRITWKNVSDYCELGLYRLLFPGANSAATNEFYDSIIAPIVKHDAENDSDLLRVALKHEELGGNIREIAAQLFTHENTIRYRLARIKKLLAPNAGERDFAEQLAVAAKIHRIKAALAESLL